MMKISKNSWHYILVRDKLELIPKRSLCAYFWQVVLSLFLMTVGYVIVLFGSAASVTPIVSIFVPVNAELFVCGLLIYFIILWFFYDAFYNDLYVPRKRAKLREKDCIDVEKKPNILIEYVKSVKNKVCPVLDFVDD